MSCAVVVLKCKFVCVCALSYSYSLRNHGPFAPSGDEAVGRLVAGGVMKQWVQDGITMCSYRNIKVGREEGTQDDTIVQRVAVFSLCV